MAVSAKGTKILVGDGQVDPGPEVFTEVPGARDLTWPQVGPQTQDVTAHDSPGDRVEKIATIVDSGEINFDVNWDPTNTVHTDIYTRAEAREIVNWQLETPNADFAVQFPGFVRASFSSPVSGAQTMSVTIDITGAVDDVTAE